MQLDSNNNPLFNIPFKLAASFYGHAQRFDQNQFKGQLALFIGDEDDRSPLKAAIALQQAANQSSLSIYHYPNAKHGFDNSYLPQSTELVDETGMIYHLGYNREAHEQSIIDLLNYLKNL